MSNIKVQFNGLLLTEIQLVSHLFPEILELERTNE